MLRFFLACCVFISHSVATAVNSGDSSASRAQVLSSKPPVQNSQVGGHFTPTSWSSDFQIGRPNCFPYNNFARDLAENTVSNSNSIVLYVFVAAETCFTMRYLETGCITPLFINLLRSNGYTCCNIQLLLKYFPLFCCRVRSFLLFSISGDKLHSIESWVMKFCTETDSKHNYALCVKYCMQVNFINKAELQNFDAIPHGIRVDIVWI
jgi:hypothetical protein